MLRYKLVKKMIVEMLANLPENSLIPSRNILCSKLDASRMTIDKAIKELEEEGVVHSIKGKGTFVSGNQLQFNDDKEKTWGVFVPWLDKGKVVTASSIIPMIGHDNVNNIFYHLYQGIVNFATQKGINVLLSASRDDMENQESSIKNLWNMGIRNFLIVPIITADMVENLKVYENLVKSGCNVVLCSRDIDGMDIPIVKSSDFYGGYIATKHLIERGYKHIAYVSTLRFRTSFERCQGYLSALMEANLPIDRKLIFIPEDYAHPQQPEDTFEMMLQESPEIDGVFCFNDSVAEKIYGVLKLHNRKVSKDVGIVGFANMGFGAYLNPPLTTVEINTGEVGKLAAEILFKLQSNLPLSAYNQYIVKSEVVVRESSKGKGV